MALSDVAIRNAKPAQKPYKLADAGGLYLQVTPSGGKLWRLKYRHLGKEKVLSYGHIPAWALARLARSVAPPRSSSKRGWTPAR